MRSLRNLSFRVQAFLNVNFISICAAQVEGMVLVVWFAVPIRLGDLLGADPMFRWPGIAAVECGSLTPL
jgi:hypothetical protein